MNLIEKFLIYVNTGYILLNIIKIHRGLSRWLYLHSSQEKAGCVLESSWSIVFNCVGGSNHANKTDKCLGITVKIKIEVNRVVCANCTAHWHKIILNQQEEPRVTLDDDDLQQQTLQIFITMSWTFFYLPTWLWEESYFLR